MRKNQKAILASLLVFSLLLNAGCVFQEKPSVKVETGAVELLEDSGGGTGGIVLEEGNFRIDLEKRQAEIQVNHPEKVKIFLTLLNDKGKFGKFVGCGDSIVGILRSVDKDEIPVVAALEELFSIKDNLSLIKDDEFKDLYKEISGKELGIGTPSPGSENMDFLYNALNKSELKVSSIISEGGDLFVKIDGEYAMGGDCDGERFVEQIMETVLQFDFIKDVKICINSRPLEEVGNLSGKPIVENYCQK